MKKYSIQKIQCFMMHGSTDTNSLGLKGPIHDSDLQPKQRSTTATKYPLFGLQQPQPRFAGHGCSRSEFSDICWQYQNFQIYVANTRIFRYLLAISEFSDICWQYQNFQIFVGNIRIFFSFQHGTAIQLRKI